MRELIEIIRYPIKSTRGQKLPMAHLGPSGMEQDRRFALVNTQGVVVTAREYPQMNLIEVQGVDNVLRVRFGVQSLTFELNAGQTHWVRHYSAEFSAQSISAPFDQWVSDLLQTRLILVKNDAEQKRFMHKYNRADQEITMVDAAPLLLINQQSVDALNVAIEPAVHRDVFRANLVVNSEAYSELNAQSVRIGQLDFDIVAPCTRCKLTTIRPDSRSFRKDGEPLRTLSKEGDGKAVFGVYLVARSAQSIQIGDLVEFY